MSVSAQPKVFTKLLLAKVDPNVLTHYDVPLGVLAECSRHQLTLVMSPDPPSAGTLTVRGIPFGANLAPAHIDSRLDAIAFSTLGSQMIVFYGFFSALRFDFTSFPTGVKFSAYLVSHLDSLLLSGSAP